MPSCLPAAGAPSLLESSVPPEPPWIRQELRVPREDGTLFARPELREAIGRARDNQAMLDACQVDLAFRTLSHLRQWSRNGVLAAAREYTAELIGESLPEPSTGPLFVGGHQPALFHPGVWVKNFAIGVLAKSCGGAALNLVIDNDTLSATHVRVPAGDRETPRLDGVPFDDDRPTQPWEGAEIVNRTLFESFGRRVGEALSAWGVEPLVNEMWPDAVAAAERTGSLPEALTAARHRQERRWGTANLELPISRLCRLDPFLWFASHLLVELPRFRQIHNEVLGEFRRVNRVRSRTHPVPELTAETGGWLEAPFWVWREGAHRRSRVFARQVDRELHLSDGEETFARLPLAPGGEACCAVEVLRDLPAQGIHLRTRALTTTLFARLCLADMFVHGIGGSKYDEMTDRIIHRFYRLPAPSFLTLSATLHLPLAEPYAVAPADVRRLEQLQRDLRYNSDRHVPEGAALESASLIEEKQRLIAGQEGHSENHSTRRQRRQSARENHDRYRRLQEIGSRLSELTAEQQRRVSADIAEAKHQLSANEILQNRELSFCLYPADKLSEFMTGLPIE